MLVNTCIGTYPDQCEKHRQSELVARRQGMGRGDLGDPPHNINGKARRSGFDFFPGLDLHT